MLFRGMLLTLAGAVLYLKLPFSPLKQRYLRLVEELDKQHQVSVKKTIAEDDLKELPEAIQEYFVRNGYVGISSVEAVQFDFRNVQFSLGVKKPSVKMDYVARSYSSEPTRVAFIDSALFGIPFQGIDLCHKGRGSMKGFLAKHIPLFDSSFEMVDASYLAECLMHPSLALSPFITYEQLTELSVKATIEVNNVKTIGVFHFNSAYEMEKLSVEARLCADTNHYEKWSAVTSDYKVHNGINRPTRLQAIWHYPVGDLVYFDGRDMQISYIQSP